MTLPDNAFFELIRTVFGKVNTPFNKQILASDLEKFLMRGDIQKNIASYINKQDARMIAAVAFLNEPCPSDLETFFLGDLSYAELNDQLVNLEERFILYRFQDEDKSQGFKHLTLNPIFKSILLPYIANTALLFPSVHMGETTSDENQTNKNTEFPLLYDDRTPAVLLSFVSMNDAFFKNKGGGIRQKVLNASQTLFPSLPMEALIGGLQVLGLLFTKDDRLIPDYRRFSAFGRLNRQERAEYYTAGIFWYRESAPFKDGADSADSTDSAVSPWLMRTKVRFCATFIHRLCMLLDPDRLYSIATLRKLAYALERENNDISINKLVDTMKQTGLLVSVSNEYVRKHSFAEFPMGGGAPEGRAVIAMDASFSLMVYPEIEYNDLVKIAAFSHVTEAGLNVRFELNRDSAVSAFNMGISANSIIELLQRLSQNRIDDNLIYALRDWEKSHREVILRQGLVLTLSPERQYLAETRPLSTLITETLAPGIYMLPATLEERVVRALQKAGISIIARHGEQSDENRLSDGSRFDGYSSNFYPSFPSVNFNSLIYPNGLPPNEKPEGDSSANDETGDAARDLTQSFHSALKKMRMDKEKQDELEARINRRLILCESQLKDAVLRYEKLEARGLDYNGKTLIAKQAISLQSLVEVVWPVNQKRERVFGIPKALDKTGSESILIIKPMDGEDDEDVVRIPLGKISLLRRIKRSIFETNIV